MICQGGPVRARRVHFFSANFWTACGAKAATWLSLNAGPNDFLQTVLEVLAPSCIPSGPDYSAYTLEVGGIIVDIEEIASQLHELAPGLEAPRRVRGISSMALRFPIRLQSRVSDGVTDSKS